MNKRRIAQFITALCVCFTLIFGLLTPGTVYAAKVIKTKHTGSLKDPIPVGETYTTKGTSNYLGQDLTATYSLTVKSSKDISKKTMKKMGLRVADDDFKYKLVDITISVKNAKIKAEDGKGVMYKNLIIDQFRLWGSQSKNSSIIGGLDYGFDKSISRQSEAENGFSKLYEGKKCSYTLEAQVIVPVKSGEKFYMVFKDPHKKNYDDTLIHFKFK